MAYKAPKPTKAQLAEAKVRASASGISMNQSAQGLRNASKAIIAGASVIPAGRAVKAASTVARNVGGITGKGAAKINPVYKETGNSVKVIKAGSKPLTEPNRVKNIGAEIDAATKATNATAYQRFMAGNKKFFGPK
jgi:hypothetical protein